MKTSQPEHPAFDELVALTIDELPPRRADEIREHLLDCADCLAEVRGLLQLPESPHSAELTVRAADQAAAWQRLATALDAESGSEAPAPAKPIPFPGLPGGGRPAPIRHPQLASPRPWLRMLPAAAMLLAGAGIGLLARPWLYPPVDQAAATTALQSRDFYVRGQPEAPTAADCPPVGGTFVWVLVFSQRPAGAKTANVAIHDSQGQVRRLAPKPIDTESKIELALPWRLVPKGDYVVEVTAEGSDGKKAREEFPVSVDCK